MKLSKPKYIFVTGGVASSLGNTKFSLYLMISSIIIVM